MFLHSRIGALETGRLAYNAWEYGKCSAQLRASGLLSCGQLCIRKVRARARTDQSAHLRAFANVDLFFHVTSDGRPLDTRQTYARTLGAPCSTADRVYRGRIRSQCVFRKETPIVQVREVNVSSEQTESEPQTLGKFVRQMCASYL